MRNPLYLTQLKRDLDRWIAAGLVEARHREAILASAGEVRLMQSLPAVLLTLGVILIGFFAMSFVAANWSAMDKLPKLLILFGAMGLAYAIGARLIARGRGALGQAFVLLGVALFGVNIMLIAQIYHIRAHDPDAVRLWALGALGAAVLVPSRPALAASLVIAGVWSWMEVVDYDAAVHLPHLLFIVAAALVVQAFAWSTGLHLVMLSLVFFLVLNAEALRALFGLSWLGFMAALCLLLLTGWAKGQVLERFGYPFARLVTHYSVFLLALTLFLLQFPEGPGTAGLGLPLLGGLGALALALTGAGLLLGRVSLLELVGAVGVVALAIGLPLLVPGDDRGAGLQWLTAAGVIAFYVWMVTVGARTDDRFLVNWGFVGFGAEALYIYFETFETLLDSALFFLVGGLLLIALGFGLERVRRRIHPQGGTEGKA
ncbi:MAG: DUF2157 domain-containing protein [Alphaproteobacteria bacterium]|nr:DUF2157 domain-containing protein [Alphaproteobacteria bacterium]